MFILKDKLVSKLKNVALAVALSRKKRKIDSDSKRNRHPPSLYQT